MAGYGIIFLFMLLHDWVPLGSLNDVSAVMADRSAKELLVVTAIGVGQVLLLIGLILLFIGKRYPLWAKLWLVIHPSFIFGGALIAWWIPYLFGIGAQERAPRYQEMFGSTHSFLPVMNGMVPNTIHFIFHATLLLSIILTIYIFLTDRKKAEQHQGITS
ncbi:hypothetical protein [Paenibacillus sp. J2TS4]|uniref:hypothetical protein n=1 Tax=Paenibacillus sp. J2TS4 TaxID=2807194 RepID=UPI0020BF66BD|nr:hypothetical protein [Paenibacillus sp. J2TS4]